MRRLACETSLSRVLEVPESERTQRILDRLPSFYRTWEPNSVIYKFIDAFGRRLAEQQKDLFRILRSHWLDTAFGGDLDNLGEIFDLQRKPHESDDEYRRRIKNAVAEFRGGGTREAILTVMRFMLGAREGENIELIENPATRLKVKKKVISGDSWVLGSMSVEDAIPDIELVAEDGGLRILNPVITNADTGETLRFKGQIKQGQKLSVRQGSAQLGEADVTAKVSTTIPPKLLRIGSNWRFEEELSAKVGVFDRAVFDESIFEVPVAATTIWFEWTALQPATFELRIPADVLNRSGLSKEDLEASLNVIKAAGVRALVAIVE
jgi:hypothetical protein